MKSRLLLITVLFVNILFSQNYHDTQGKLDVSPSGQATYTIPIANPPTLNDVAPVINLVYASGQMGGIAGQGWNIASISAIQRIATRKDIDGYTDGVDFDSNDMLALDGQRLILKTGTYWADGSTYETEVMSNTKIELMGSGSSMYFIVTTPDGARSWYGMYGTTIAKDITAFYILRYEDTWGNYIAYTYSKPFNKSLCIDKIYYSANGSTITPQNSINFYYKQAQRAETAFVGSNKIEKVELLDRIEVYTNGLLFRKYQLTHVPDTQLGYEKLTQVLESNGADEPTNPIFFEYNDTQSTSNGMIETSKSTNNVVPLDNIKISGDFDGDGRLDFATNNKIYTKILESSNNGNSTSFNIPYANKLLTATTLSNNKLNQFSSIVSIKLNENSTDFNIYNLNTSTNTLDNNSTKNVAINNLETIFYSNRCENEDYSYTNIKSNAEYIEGDFNGDGISEIFILNTVNQESYENVEANYAGDCDNPDYTYYSGYESIETYLVDLNSNSSSVLGSSGYVKFNFDSFIKLAAEGQKHLTADFNGDGKTDILVLNQDKNYKVYGFKQLTQSPWVELEIIGQGILGSTNDPTSQTITNIFEIKDIFLGDFNGDGKTDLIVPHSNYTRPDPYNDWWWIMYSNPKANNANLFSDIQMQKITDYMLDSGDTWNYQQQFNSYHVMDINKDGKSDLVRIWQRLVDDGLFGLNSEWIIHTYTNHIGNSTIDPIFQFPLTNSSTSTHEEDFDDEHDQLIIPLVTPIQFNGITNEICMIKKKRGGLYYDVYAINFTKDFSIDVLLKKVISNNNSCVDEILYGGIDSTNSIFQTYTSNPLYNAPAYPFVNVKRLPNNFYLVSSLKNTLYGNSKTMDFGYSNLIVNLHGLGTIGFQKTVRSSWFKGYHHYPDNVFHFNITKFDPLKRGALIYNASSLTSNDNIDPNSYSTNTFETQTLPNGVFKIWLTNQKTVDNIAGVTNETIYETYDTNYLIPTKVVAKNYLNDSPTVIQGTTTTYKEFYNNASGTGNSYYIGRPKTTLTTISAYNDIFSSKEKYTYTGNKLTKVEKKGNTTDEKYVVEDFIYDNYGNILKRTLSSTGYSGTKAILPRIEEYTYDETGRYVKTHKDIEGLVTTNNTFHPMYGLVTSSTNPFGLTSTSVFDNWGKTIKNTDYLGKSINYTYQKVLSNYNVTTTGDDGSSSVSKSNVLGQVIAKGVKDIQSNWSWIKIEYDYLGRKTRQSEPYYANATPSLWSVTEYDEYSRPIKTTVPSGLVTNISYNGLSVTVTDGNKTASTTKNANGHTTATTDNGGTINYNYYANGSLKNSILAGTPITFEYDEWSRKTKMNDPSLGIYQYEYNAIGETLKEITPNGATTYLLSTIGKLNNKYTISNAGNTGTSYTYDPTTKLLTNINHTDFISSPETSFTNTYQYDTYKRLWKTTETTNQAKFETEISFDDFGRPQNEKRKATNFSDNKFSESYIQNIYQNGYLYQIYNNIGDVKLYEVSEVNQRGQVTKFLQGSNTQTTQSYDIYGITSGSSVNKVISTITSNILTLTNPFDPQRGNLLSRSNSMFNWSETFQYDNLDRLTQYKNAQGQYVTQNYDPTGKITSNEVGDYNYTNSAKPYQNTSIDLNTASNAYYTHREGIFNDDMENESNWPIYTSHFSFDTSQKHSGEKSLKITNPNATEKVIHSEKWVPINNATDTQYTYSGWVYSNGPQSQIFLFMKTETETGYFTYVDDVVNNTTNQWVYVEKTFTVPANIKKLGIRLDNNGNGTVWFDDVRIRKTSELSNVLRQLDITYNAYRSPLQISETGVERIDIAYNVSNDRAIMYYGSTNSDKNQRSLRKFYSADGSMEIKRNTVTGAVDFITYIGGDAYSAPIVLKSDGVTQNYLYLHRDYQGSILAISNDAGEVLEKRLFDAWGNVVKISNQHGEVLSDFVVLDRGYTGHEHLMRVGLINMNARLYDPKLHRFLQADSDMQDPSNTQYYNRYGYVLNNPLRYVDPDGNNPFLIGALIAVAVSAGSYIYSASTHLNIGFSTDGFIQTIGWAIISSVATFGVGTIATTIKDIVVRIVFQTLAHGLIQGGISVAQGGSFISGFASGALSSLTASLWSGGETGEWQGIGGKFADKDIGTILFGTVAGGLGAELSGGNFWQGAATGLIVSGLNHFVHQVQEKNAIVKKAGIIFTEYLGKKEFNYDEFNKELKNVLVSNGFSTKTEVTKYSDWKAIKAFFNGTPTATVSVRGFYSKGAPLDVGVLGYAYPGSNYAVSYGGGRILGNNIGLNYTRLANVSVHELGHAIFSFDHVSSGLMYWKYGSGDLFGTVNPFIFEQEQLNIVKKSMWGQ